ncbi:dTDP-glucose 4,6-dehydratase [Gammaproteobacteria bacterium]|nr:dTDP-glucose 4,6-dehydratase [Gammaproteobacteria bacterium]
MNILITGSAGFIGANFLEYFLSKYPNYNLTNLDLCTYAADKTFINDIQHKRLDNFSFIEGDIRDRQLIESIFSKNNIQSVIHFAAESHVDNSIKEPQNFLETNVNGTFTLIDVAKNYWMEKPFMVKKEFLQSRFIHISTDEVYGSLEIDSTEQFTESSNYAPSSPYSASKASSDMLVNAYNKTFGMRTVITNCSNNYGPRQHDEKLIPTIVRSALNEGIIPIYGNGKQVRDWLYVLDHCMAIDTVFHKGKIGNTYNIGGNTEKNNLEIASMICEILDEKCPKDKSYKDQITHVEDRPGHDLRYAIDASKIKNQLQFEPSVPFSEGIKKTIDWYINKYSFQKK